jgi:hypothetical protein
VVRGLDPSRSERSSARHMIGGSDPSPARDCCFSIGRIMDAKKQEARSKRRKKKNQGRWVGKGPDELSIGIKIGEGG